ncbi:MAG: EscU/YscU/HrcU family type III secretion system export apparatus switch protein, partial [bacterium]|nr:EscU/YscU/HrcU family type III secretion system export apparatus switch protein [bacterium]
MKKPEINKAVALKYEHSRDRAPLVIAKGSGKLAEKIIEIAEEHGIKIYEDKELISTLMKLDIGDYIREELYPVVAQILAFIYSLDRTAGN